MGDAGRVVCQTLSFHREQPWPRFCSHSGLLTLPITHHPVTSRSSLGCCPHHRCGWQDGVGVRVRVHINNRAHWRPARETGPFGVQGPLLWWREGALYMGGWTELSWVVICSIKAVTTQKAAPPWIWGVLHPGPAAAGRPRWWWDKRRSASVVTERTNGPSDCGGGTQKWQVTCFNTHTKTQIHM